MKGLLSAVLLGSGCLASVAGAQEVQWRASRPESAPRPSLASCVTIGPPRPLPAAADPSPAPISQAVYRPPGGPARVVRLSAESLDPPPAPAPSHPWGTFHPTATDLPPAAATEVTAPPDDEALIPDGFGADPARFYARAEYLMWWFKEAQLPPLVTTGPADVAGIPGTLGAPGTVVLFGGSAAGGEMRSGARLTAGVWCDDEHEMGVEASGFFVGRRSFRFAANSAQFPVLARPFFNLNALSEFAEVATAPGLASGGVNVEGPSSLWGAEIDLRCNLCCGCDSRLDFLAGPRYLQLNEGLHVEESLLGLEGAGTFAGSRIFVGDHFDTHNQFFGGQAGLDYQLSRGPWSLGLTGKLALGETHQVVKVAGEQVILSPAGAVSTANGGLLALASNSGRFTRDRFAVLPEAGVSVGWQPTAWLRLSVGYNFLYVSSVVRPGDQIDRVIDVSQIPNSGLNATPTGLPRPAPLVRATDFWAQGITFGVELRY